MRGRVEVDRELCKGCGYCVVTCPKKVLVIDEDFNSQGYYPVKVALPEECTGCSLCAEICPDIAITVWKQVSPLVRETSG